MRLVQVSPIRLNLEGTKAEIEQIRPHLSYTDKSVVYHLTKFKNNKHYHVSTNGLEWFNAEADRLKAESKQSLLFQDDQGFWCLSGLKDTLLTKFGHLITGFENQVVYPEPKTLAWKKKSPFALRECQQEAVDRLLAQKHAAVSLPTGVGKSLVITELVKRLGLKTLIMAPTVSIAKMLYDSLQESFGSAFVGMIGAGKKVYGRQITVAVGASLVKVEPGSDLFKELATTQVFIADESHMTPAATLAKVCQALVANTPYRFFVSATQMRGDGRDLLLEAIIGPVVLELSVREAINKGWLSKMKFRTYKVPPNGTRTFKDPMKSHRHHHLYNPHIVQKACQVINALAKTGKQILVLIDEIGQFGALEKGLQVQVGFAHAGVTKDNKASVPPAYHKSDPADLVEKFNNKQIQVLVGTSCIGMGTDTKACEVLVYLMGGASEVQVYQAIGRGTRVFEGKKDCLVVDFSPQVDLLERHSKARYKYYQEISDDIRIIK